jgi:hypothetical protein
MEVIGRTEASVGLWKDWRKILNTSVAVDACNAVVMSGRLKAQDIVFDVCA